MAEIYAPGRGELIRMGRTKLKRFMCARCSAKRPRPGCKRCTRLQEHNPNGLVSYFNQHRVYMSVEDVQTVCGDIVFVPAKHLKQGDVIVEHSAAHSRRHVVTGVERGASHNIRLTLSDASTKLRSVWRRDAKCMLPVLPREPDNANMMRDNAAVVHGMGMSVHPDKISEGWMDASFTLTPPPTTSPLRLSSLSGGHLKEYAMWRCLVAVVQHLVAAKAPSSIQNALRAADTQCLHHEQITFCQR